MVSHDFFAMLNKLAIFFPVFLLVFTWRGFVKAFVAKLMGDDTAQEDGFLTLNPLAHVDILGLTIILFALFFLGWMLSETLPRGMLVLMLLAFGIRWTIPISINDSNFKHYRLGGILTSLSGSLGNFVLAFFMILLGKILATHVFLETSARYVSVTIFELLRAVIDIAVWFGVIDLIPIPPFDGGRALRYLLPHSQQHIVDWLEEYSLFIILILFFVPFISDFFWGALHMFNLYVKALMIKLLF